MAEITPELRVPCACGQDDAPARYAQCYRCRNEPHQRVAELAAALEAAEARVRALVTALAQYGRHRETCDFSTGIGFHRPPDTGRFWKCSCGLAQALLTPCAPGGGQS